MVCRQTILLQMIYRLSSTNITRSIIEYLDLYKNFKCLHMVTISAFFWMMALSNLFFKHTTMILFHFYIDVLVVPLLLSRYLLTEYQHFNTFICCESINPFLPSAPFLYPLKTSGNRKVFYCFQGVEKGYIGNEWINVRTLKNTQHFQQVSARKQQTSHIYQMK